MTFNDMEFVDQKFDITISEDGSSYAQADINKETAGELNVDMVLRVPAGAAVNMAIVNDTYDPNPDYDAALGSVRIQDTLTAAAGANVLAVSYGPTADYDGDGLTDQEEINTYGTSPLSSDTDNDGLPDGYEVQNGLNANANDACANLDGDPVDNVTEFDDGTDPQDANSYLHVTSVTAVGPDTQVTWQSVAGKDYTLLATTDPLTQPYTDISGVVASGGTSTSYTHPGSAYADYEVVVAP
jgi:hypothetical protein